MAFDSLLSTQSKTVQIFNDLNQINFVGIAEIVIVSWVLIWLVKTVLPWLAKRVPGRLRLYLLPSVPVLRLIILLAAIALIVPMVIKTSMQNVIAVLGFAVVAIGFAFKEYISSLLAGVVAVYERPYRVGDWVTVDGAYGEVISMNLRAMRIFTFDDTVVTIPHIKIWENNIYNANDGKRNLLCVANFFVDPNHDAALVRQKLHDVAQTSPFLDMDHPIRVIVQEQPWGSHYQLKAYPLDGRDQFLFISDLTVRGKAALAKMGVAPVRAVPAPAVPDYAGQSGDRAGQP
jgi:small conductance mechanosensitive channel